MASHSFSRWLGLRERADGLARSIPLTQAVAERLKDVATLRALDLAAGTGTNFRYLAPRLDSPTQEWLLVDHDRDLLTQVRARMPEWGERPKCTVETRELDLETLDHPEVFADRQLVTAAALLDLVSDQWLRALAARCRASEAAVILLALTYNGQSYCSPAEPEDEIVRNLFNRHQKSAKGVGGPALGPDAVDSAERAFSAEGFLVERAASDWILEPELVFLRLLQKRLLEGWAEAATEVAPEQAAVIRDWLSRRIGHVDAGRSRIVVGHEDLAAFPKSAICNPQSPI